jgi:hypothetical protein
MLQYLKKFFTRSSPSVGPTQPIVSSINTDNPTPQYNGSGPKDQIVFAFTDKGTGKNYFAFSNDINVPYERMHAAQDIYRELDYGVNPEILKAHTIAIETILTNTKWKPEKKMLEIGVLNARLQERLELAISLQLSIKLATVKYFDEIEDPFDYQHDYNLQKIKDWSKSGSVPSFFLSLPQNQFMTSGPELAQSLATILKGETIMNLKELKHLTTLIPSESIGQEFENLLALQLEQQQVLNDWSDVPVTNTT